MNAADPSNATERRAPGQLAAAGAASKSGLNLGPLWRVALEARRQERSSRWSVEQLRRHQARALAELRRFAVERSPFYRDFHRGLAQRPLETLPILEKATLMAEFDRIVSDPAVRLADVQAHLSQADAPDLYRGRYTVLATSGSTGVRGVFLFDPHEWTAALAAITRPMAWAGAPPPWRRTRSALIASSAPWHYSARVGRSLSSSLLANLRLDAALPLAAMVAQLNAWQPEALAAYPSVLLQLAEEQLAGRLRIPLRHIATSAERLPCATRERVHAAWGVPMFDTYGATEYAPIATQCREGHLHLLEDRAIIEVVDERGRAVPPGEPGARVLLTVLDRHTQPLVRYEISDAVRERPGRCPCGRPFRMLAGIEGRVEEILRFDARAGGSPVELHPNDVHALLERVPASGWQLVEQTSGSLEILFTGVPRAEVSKGVRDDLARMLDERGAAVPPIDVRWVDALPRGATGKAPLIVSRRRNRAPRA